MISRRCEPMNMNMNLILQRLVVIILTILVLQQDSVQGQQVQIELNLSNRNLNNLNNLLVHTNGRIYLASENQLLSIDATTFDIIEQIRYGPVYDSINCKYHPKDECQSQQHATTTTTDNKYLTNNFNKLLIVHPNKRQLLSCWSAYQCTCDLRDLNNLTNVVQTSKQAVCVNDYANTTIGFLSQSPSAQDLLIIANTYNANGPYRDDIPAISGRLLSENAFMSILTNNNQGLKETKASIEFLSRQLKTFIVRYVYGFSTPLYNYILTVQSMDTDTQLKGDPLVTKIIRLCKNDLSFIKSYVEIPLSCNGYNELVSAKLMDNMYLLGVFKQSNSINHRNGTVETSNGQQAICIFNMNQLKTKINDNLNECLFYSTSSSNGKTKWRGLNYIKPDQMCKGTMNKITDDYCASSGGENTASLYPIGGRIPLKHQYLFELNDDSSINMVNVYARPDTGQYTLIALSNTDNKLTFYTINMVKTTMTAYKQVNLHAQSTLTIKPLVITHPHTNLVISHNDTEATLYLINKNYLYKIGLVDCGQHGQSCDKCTAYDECGWCATTKTCGYRSECQLATCENENEVNSIVYDPNARNKTIVFEFVARLNLTSTVRYRCVFGTQCDTTTVCLDVDVVPLDPYKIMCPLPTSSLDRLIDSNGSKRYNDDDDDGTSPIQVVVNLIDTKTNTSRKQVRLDVVDCGRYRSCVQCSKHACNWCANRCVTNDHTPTTVCTTTNETCETFDVGSTKVLIPHTPHKRLQAPIPVQLRNSGIVVSYTNTVRTCLLMPNISLPYKQLNETHGHCLLDNIFDRLINDNRFKTGEYRTKLRMHMKGNDDDDGYLIDTQAPLEIVFYSCEYLANDCQQCTNLKPYLSCNWCENVHYSSLNRSQSCIFVSQTSMKMQLLESQQCHQRNNAKCNAPQIVSIEPAKVPLGGGSLVTIRGLNLGRTIHDIENVSICDAKCLLNSDYIAGKEVKCLTTAQADEKDCGLSVRLRDTNGLVVDIQAAKQTPIAYVDPQIHEIHPNTIIQYAANVQMTITGKHLDAGSHRDLYFVDAAQQQQPYADGNMQLSSSDTGGVQMNKCLVESVSTMQIKCTLVANFARLGRKNLKIQFDSQMSIMHYGSVRVEPNPVLLNINNLDTTCMGGVKFILNGEHLSAVQNITFQLKNNEYGIETERMAAWQRVSDNRVIFKYPKIDFAALARDRLDMYPVFYMDSYVKQFDTTRLTYHAVDDVEQQQQAAIFQFQKIDLAAPYTSGSTVVVVVIQFKTTSKPLEKRFRFNLNVYTRTPNRTYCECLDQVWMNDTYLTCQLKVECNNGDQLANSATTTAAAIASSEDFIRLFIGHYEVKQQHGKYETSERFATFARNQIDNSLGHMQVNEVLILITAIVLLAICVLLVFLVVFIYKRKKLEYKNRMFYLNTLNTANSAKAMHMNLELYKQLKIKVQYFEQTMQKQCDYNYERLKIGFVNEFNADLVYSGMPLYTYKAYMFNCLFDNNNNNNSNKTMLLLLLQQQHTNDPTNYNNPYATIKSSSIYNTNGLNVQCSSVHHEAAMHLFDQLMHNKTFLTAFLCVANGSGSDRTRLSSLVLLLFNDNLSYLYTVVKTLLADMIRDLVMPDANNNNNVDEQLVSLKPKRVQTERTLFTHTRPNTIVELIVESLFKMFMYDYVRDNFAVQLYRLINIVKYQVESGPVDNCLDMAYNCLDARRTMADIQVIYKQVYINCIDAHDLSRVYKCKILDCDSVRQVKAKCLDCMYKNSAYSQRACVDDIVLEIRIITTTTTTTMLIEQQQQESIVELKEYNDEDLTVMGKRLLTAKDYCLYDGVYVYLSLRPSHTASGATMRNNRAHPRHNYFHLMPPPGGLMSMTMTNPYACPQQSTMTIRQLNNNAMNDQHLLSKKANHFQFIDFKNNNNSGATMPLVNDTIIQRLLVNKGAIKPFVDNMFESIFANVANLPPIIKNLFDFVDIEMRKYPTTNNNNNGDCDLYKRCLNNLFFNKIWMNLIRRPELIFDLDKTPLIGASLDCIASAFGHSCSMDDRFMCDPDINTMRHGDVDTTDVLNELMFSKEICDYKLLIDSFYNEIKTYPVVADHELHFYLNEYAKRQPNDLNKTEILLNIYECYEKFDREISMFLAKQESSVQMPLHQKIVQVKDLMNSSNQINSCSSATTTSTAMTDTN